MCCTGIMAYISYLPYIFGLVTMYSAYYLALFYRRHRFTMKERKILGQGKITRKKAEMRDRRKQFVRDQVSLG